MSKGFGKLAIGCRVGTAPDPDFFKAWTHIAAGHGLKRGDVVLSPAAEFPHHWTAEVLADKFLKDTDCDTLLMIDDDMVYEPGDLVAIRSHRTNWPFDMVQGLCCSRRSGHMPLLLGEVDGPGELFRPMKPDPGDRTVAVGMCGLAFTLIRRGVFEAVRKRLPDDEMFFQWGPEGRGEDTSFCRHARKAGKRIAVDCRVNIAHRVKIHVSYDIEAGCAVYHSPVDKAFKRLLDARKAKKRKAGG